MLCDIVSVFCTSWPFGSPGFAAFSTALSTKFKIFFFACEDSFSSLATQLAGLIAACLLAQFGDEAAAIVGIFNVESHSVGSHKQAKFPS